MCTLCLGVSPQALGKQATLVMLSTQGGDTFCLTSRDRHSLDLKERPSGSQMGESRPSLGTVRSESLVTYCCIFIMEFCDAGEHAPQPGLSGRPQRHPCLFMSQQTFHS